jgi:uncharacterized repeat protein (TIGR01451 family)
MKIKKYFSNIAQYTPQLIVLVSVLTSNVFVPAVAIAEEISDLQGANAHLEEEIPIDDSEDILEEGVSTSIDEEEVDGEVSEESPAEDTGQPIVDSDVEESETDIPEEIDISPKEELIKYELLSENQNIEDTNQNDWFISDEMSTTRENVKIGIRYIFPLDEEVTVTFTKLPFYEKDRSPLTIKTVSIEDLPDDFEGKNVYAVDISTKMINEEFEYIITFPKPEGENVEVFHMDDLNSTVELDGDYSLEGNTVKRKLNHMSIQGVRTQATSGNLCGNGVINPGEECDSTDLGNYPSSDFSCKNNCQLELIEHQINICHRNHSTDNSHTNPYVPSHPSKIADVQGHDGHDGPIWFPGITVAWGDIIPPFYYLAGTSPGYYVGKNWTTVGELIYNNGCEIPQTGTIHICKYNDLDINGLIDTNDPLIAWDIKITDLDGSTGKSLNTSTPDGDCLTLNDFEFGEYEITESNVPGWEISSLGSSDTYNIKLDLSNPEQTVNFLNYEIPDSCGNGILNDNEQCDYGDLNGQSICSSSCTLIRECLPEMAFNGDFQIPTVTDDMYWDIFPYNEVPGWTADWYSTSTSYGDQTRPEIPNIEIHAGVNGWTSGGNQYIELDSDWDGPGGSLNGEPSSLTIYKQIPVIKDYEYTLSWSYSPRPNHNNNSLEVSIDGNVIFNSGVIAGTSSVIWLDKSYTFIPDTDQIVTIRFTETGAPDSRGMFLDNVSIECLGPTFFCGDGILNGDEQCDGTEGVTEGQNFCTYNCELIPIYDGEHSCPKDTKPIYRQSVNVSGIDPDGETVSLKAGGQYLFEASGEYNANSTWKADAGYSTIDDWSSNVSEYGIWGTPPHYGAHALLADFGMGVGVVQWDDDDKFNTMHKYSKYYEPTKSEVQFVIGDRYGDWFDTDWDNQTGMNDNYSFLTVDVYECVIPPKYSCNETIYAVNNEKDLSWVDNDTGINNIFSTLNFGSSASADHPYTEKTYYIDRYGNDLAVYDHTLDSHSIVGSTGVTDSYFTKLAFDLYGELYGLTDKHDIYQIDTSNGLATTLGNLSGIDTGADIIFDEANTLYLLDRDGSLFTVNLSTLNTTLVKETGIIGVTGLAYVKGLFYVSTAINAYTNSNIYSMDKNGDNITKLNSEPQPIINDLSSCLPGIPKTDIKVCKEDDNGKRLNGWDIILASEPVQGPTPINVSDSNGTDSNVLPKGSYLVKVSGTYRYRNSEMNADAGYSYRPMGIPSGCDCWLSGLDLPSGTGLMARINDTTIDWGVYNGLHEYIYVYDHTAEGPINISILDNFYTDNVNNNFQFEISEIVDQGITTDDGCVEFEDIYYGSYYLDELLQKYFVRQSGTGIIEVNEQNTEFIIINEDNTPYCGDGVINQEFEECDGIDGVTDDYNFCTPTCKLIPIYDGDHSCDPGTTPVKIGDTYTIDSKESDGIEIDLEKDQEYLFKVSGTYQFGNNPNRLADAAYGTEDNWNTINTKYGIWGDTGRGVLSVLANLGKGVGVVEWDDDSDFNDPHVYEKAYTPTEDITAQFLISDWYDEWYNNSSCDNQGCMGDNSGSLDLEVYECIKDSKITGYKWNDKNGDKEFNSNESGLEGWNIKAVKPIPLADFVVDSADMDGTDTINLPVGDYLIVVEGTWKDTSKNHWIDAEYLTETEWTSYIDGIGVVGENQKDLQINGQFVNWGPYSNNHDYYYNYEQSTDSSLNFAIYDGNTTGKVANWYNDNSGILYIKIYEVLDSTWTDDNGFYELVVPGYMEPLVFEIPQMGWVREYPTDPYHIVTFDGPGDIQSDINFGNKHVPVETKVSGYKWSDTNMDQEWNEGEDGIEGWEIYATQKVDEFEVVAKDTPTVDSILFESDKNYIIKASGTYDANDGITADAKYSVRLPNTFWTDDVQNYESYGNTLLDLQVDGNSTICDWGEYNDNHTYFCEMYGDNTIHSFEIYDLGNGSNNSGSLYVEIFEIIDSAITDMSGSYSMSLITDAFQKIYILEDTRKGFVQTSPMPQGYYDVEAGLTAEELNFGNLQQKYDIHGFKWDDLNADGNECRDTDTLTREARVENGLSLCNLEPLIGNWTIYLYKWDGDKFGEEPYRTTTTYDDSEDEEHPDNGWYWFEDLPQGKYKICEKQEENWIQTFPTNADDNCHIVNLPDENPMRYTVAENYVEPAPTYNFGNYELATLIVEKRVLGRDHIDEGFYSDQEFEVSLSGVKGTQFISDSQTDPKKATFSDLGPGFYLLTEAEVEGFEFAGCFPEGFDPEWYYSDNGEVKYDNDPFAPVIELESGETLTYICYNDTVRPELVISKSNDTGGTALLAGNTVKYTITVAAPSTPEEKGEYVLENVKVEDIFPSGFEYILGTWTANSTERGDLKAKGITTEPQYSSPGTWNLGDMKEGEIITLTYETTISELQDPGTYKDIAYTYGDTLLSGLQFYGVSTTNPQTNYVGTEVRIIEEPEVEEGEVLGAATSVELPRTGASTYLTLGAIVSMIIGFILTLINPRKKVSTYVLILTAAFGLFTLVKPKPAYAQVTEQIQVEIEQPETPSQKQQFKIGFIALPIPIDRNLEIQCYEETYGIFGPVYTTKDGDCVVDSTIITQSGTYTFYVKAQEVGNPSSLVESDKVTVVVDLETPDVVENYEKDEGTCSYTLTFKTADDNRTSKVQIFRSDKQPFTANSETLIDEITVTPNQEVSYTDDTLPLCDKEYYYAVRAVDDLNNTSPFTTDDIVSLVEVETPVQQQVAVGVAPDQGEVAGETTDEDGTGSGEDAETDENGEVIGEETEADEENGEEEETTDEENGNEEDKTFWQRYWYVILAAGIILTVFVGYTYGQRRKRE